MVELKENIEKEIESLEYLYFYYLEKSEYSYKSRINELKIEIDTYKKVLDMIN